ncbi:MAG TPA: histidinol-phosphate transaminase [Gemmatimonadaceae bacterium]|nr:histidinol-phosphate transaminase [Gemmatimonadaceae bacterium]
MPMRADLAGIPLYAPSVLADVTLDLRDNVNLWGAPPAALAAVRDAGVDALRDYPRVSADALTSALAARLDIPQRSIVAGCGSDDVIDACLRAFATPGATLAHADPSFSMVPTFARLNGLAPIGVPLRAGGAMDVDAMLATRAALIYVCSPNNPTGTVTPRDELLRLFDAAPGVVLLDEAYGEFTDAHDLRAEAARRENVLVTRTFSKAWGLAGLRVGYGVGGAALVAAVTKARGPYKVNALAERAAAAAVMVDDAWMRNVATETRAQRDRLAAALRARAGLRVWASEGNFVFAALDESATAVAERFRLLGIGVRAFSGLRGIGEALRIGAAPPAETDRVIAALDEVFA